MPRKRHLTEEEKLLWELVVKGDKLLGYIKKSPVHTPTISVKKHIPKPPPSTINFGNNLDANFGSNFDAKLDLHGMTAASAHNLLTSFIKQKSHQGKRNLLIITGKGSGMLRDSLPHWLETNEIRPLILSVAVAQQKHGGTGAYYVVLRKNRD